MGRGKGLAFATAAASCPASLSKVRHADLFDRAARTTGPTHTLSGETTARLADNDDTDYVSVIVSINPYRLVERYEYSEVFNGFAAWMAEDELEAMIETMQLDAEGVWIEPDVQVAVDPLGVPVASGDNLETRPQSVATIGAGTGSAVGVDLYVADPASTRTTSTRSLATTSRKATIAATSTATALTSPTLPRRASTGRASSGSLRAWMSTPCAC